MSRSATERWVLIIGYGNALRGDDGLGPVAAQRLAEHYGQAGVTTLAGQETGAVRILIDQQLMPELAEPISRASLVVFIDASAEDAPGQIRQVRLEPAADALVRDTHQLGPAHLLTLARLLFGQCPPALLFSVGGNSFDLSDRLTPAVEAALQVLLADVCREVDNHLGSAPF